MKASISWAVVVTALLGAAARAQTLQTGEIGRKAPGSAAGTERQPEVGHKTVGAAATLSGKPAVPKEFEAVVRSALRSAPQEYSRVELRGSEMGWYLERLSRSDRRYLTYGPDAAGALMRREDRGFTVLVWESPDEQPDSDGLRTGRAFLLDVPWDGLGSALELEVRYSSRCLAASETCAPVTAQPVGFGDGVKREVRKLWMLLDKDFQSRPPSAWPF